MKLNASKLIRLLTLSCLAAMCGCFSEPPLPYLSPARMARMQMYEMTIDGMLRDKNGDGVSGVLVSIESGIYRELSTTSNSGYFFTQAKFNADDSLDFHFRSKTLEWTETLAVIPKGVEKVTMNFVMNDNKTIYLTSIEY